MKLFNLAVVARLFLSVSRLSSFTILQFPLKNVRVRTRHNRLNRIWIWLVVLLSFISVFDVNFDEFIRVKSSQFLHSLFPFPFSFSPPFRFCLEIAFAVRNVLTCDRKPTCENCKHPINPFKVHWSIKQQENHSHYRFLCLSLLLSKFSFFDSRVFSNARKSNTKSSWLLSSPTRARLEQFHSQFVFAHVHRNKFSSSLLIFLLFLLWLCKSFWVWYNQATKMNFLDYLTTLKVFGSLLIFFTNLDM